MKASPENPTFEMLKSLNSSKTLQTYGCPMLWIEDNELDTSEIQSKLIFNENELTTKGTTN